MKRGTPEHPKTEDLAEELDICIAQAVGHLEMMWHFTAQRTPAGNIGKYRRRIHKKAGWLGDPEVFLKALIKTGWLDEDWEFGLVVHNWHKHADDTTRKFLERNDECFCLGDSTRKGSDATKGRQPQVEKPVEINSVEKCRDKSRHSRDKTPLPMPIPIPIPEPIPPGSFADVINYMSDMLSQISPRDLGTLKGLCPVTEPEMQYAKDATSQKPRPSWPYFFGVLKGRRIDDAASEKPPPAKKPPPAAYRDLVEAMTNTGQPQGSLRDAKSALGIKDDIKATTDPSILKAITKHIRQGAK